MKTIRDAADEWVFETNGHRWSNNNDECGNNYGSFLAGAKFSKLQLFDIIEEMRIELENSACELANVYNNIHNIDHCKEQSISNRETIIKIKQKLEGLND